MQLLTIIAATTGLIASSLAAPTPQPNYWWNATHWDAGCTPKHCHYSFHVAAPLDGLYPGFKAECSGQDKGFFKSCVVTGGETTSGVAEIAAKLKHQEDPKHSNDVAMMAVSLQFTDVDNGVTYNYTGHHTANFNDGAAPGKKFKVYPTKAHAVA